MGKYPPCQRLPEHKTKGERAEYITKALKLLYPEAPCALEYENDPYRLLVMARLSAQCTDERVNKVSKELFRCYPDCRAMANAPIERLEELVRSCGVYRVKAKNIKDMSAMLLERTGGEVPCDKEFLLSLPGVGPKIANLILGDVFKVPGIVADTHCIRLSNRFSLCDSDDPLKVERALSPVIEPCEQSDFCHRLVMFGREFCRAQGPDCRNCPLAEKGKE
ncbi:MAG: endonuclease III [Ruminococcaceae bacterium]|nr:endonuclease III [Oscillospiraceae bacterium]